MIDVTVLASGSSGNCYMISDQKTKLLLECGMPIQKIKEGLGFRLSQVNACLVSHGHKDHSKAAADVMKAGIDVYMSSGTIDELNLSGHRLHKIKVKEQFKIGTFNILPFNTQHDAREPVGYLIYSKATGDKLLFATDTYYIKYKFTGLTYIMVECNYSNEILSENIESGLVPEVLKNRLLESHFSLNNVKEFLKVNDLSLIKEIYLIHLSENNSDPETFKKEIQGLTGRQVIVAKGGL